MAENPLQQRIGPFPLGGWLAIAGGGIGLGLVIRRATSGFDKPAEPIDGTAAAATDPLFKTQGAQYVIPLNGGAGESYGGDPALRTNNDWVRYAVTYLVSQGQNGAVADSALRKYIEGRAVTTAEQAMIAIAIRDVGPPPEGVPPIDVIPDATTPLPTTPGTPTPVPPTTAPLSPAGAAWVTQLDAWLKAVEANTADKAVYSGLSGAGVRVGDPNYNSLSPTAQARYRWFTSQFGFPG